MGHLSSYFSTAAPNQWLHELAVLVCVKKAGVNQSAYLTVVTFKQTHTWKGKKNYCVLLAVL